MAIKSQRDAKKAANQQATDLRNAEAERKAAQDRSAQEAQMARADQRRRLRSQSLLATGAQGVEPQQSMTSTLDYGKQSLGG